jgi:hypothetical protein
VFGATPFGVGDFIYAVTQGSLADSATLGWRSQSLWDWPATDLTFRNISLPLTRSIRLSDFGFLNLGQDFAPRL